MNEYFHVSFSFQAEFSLERKRLITNGCEIKFYFRFKLFFEGFHAYVNDEKTRTFIGIKVSPTENLTRVVNACDKCLADYQLEPYYKVCHE